jgi:hypothetical protein
MDTLKWAAENDMRNRSPEPICAVPRAVLWLSPEQFQDYVSKQLREWEAFQAGIPEPGSIVQVDDGYDVFDVVAGAFDRKTGLLEVTWASGRTSGITSWRNRSTA